MGVPTSSFKITVLKALATTNTLPAPTSSPNQKTMMMDHS